MDHKDPGKAENDGTAICGISGNWGMHQGRCINKIQGGGTSAHENRLNIPVSVSMQPGDKETDW